MKRALIITTAVAVLALVSVQFAMISSLRSEVSAVRAELAGFDAIEEPEIRPAALRDPSLPQPRIATAADLQTRLASLEAVVEELSRATETLRQRGGIPLMGRDIEQMKARFNDPSATDRDRLAALRMLRRSRNFTDDMVNTAVNWLQVTTNSNTKRELVQSLDGSTNAAVKQPLLNLLATEESSRLREELVDTLSGFTEDPFVEEKLWDLAQNDPDREVRAEALEALSEGSLSEQRVISLQARALSSEAPLEDRLMAFQALRRADAESPEVLAGMLEVANTAEDPVARARVFSALDGVRDESLKAPLVYGLQDPNPVVREEAADALSHFAQSDPQVQEWLTYISQNDADPRVQREAHRALQQSRRDRR